MEREEGYVGVSKNRGTPKSSILIGFSIINHPFWGTPIFGNTHALPRTKTLKRLCLDEKYPIKRKIRKGNQFESLLQKSLLSS